MDLPTRPQRPAPRIPETRGSLADLAKTSPVGRWALILQDANDLAVAADEKWLGHAEGANLASDQLVKTDLLICEDVYSPVQRAVLRMAPTNMADAITIAAIAADLSQNLAGANLHNRDLGDDAKAIDLALVSITAFLLANAGPDIDVSPLPDVVRNSLDRAVERHGARCMKQGAAA